MSDIKKLARIAGAGHRIHGDRSRQKKRRGGKRIGYEYVHVCVDDATRLAYVEVLPDERPEPRSASCAARGSGIAATACASNAS
jgi:hypothetical protein